MISASIETAHQSRIHTTFCGIGDGMMGMHRPGGMPPAMARLGDNFSVVAQGLGACSERVEHRDNLISAYRRAIRGMKDGQAARIEVLIKPVRTPELPEGWSV